MAKIEIPPENLARKASAARELMGAQKRIIQGLTYLINDPETKELEQAKSFIMRFKSASVTLNSFTEMLEDYATLMDTYANMYTRAVYATPDIMANKKNTYIDEHGTLKR